MNTDNITKIIDWIETTDGGQFKMGNWHQPIVERPGKREYCNTAFCVAGHCEIQSQLDVGVKPEDIQIGLWSGDFGQDYFIKGGEYLGIDRETSVRLFAMTDPADGDLGIVGYSGAELRRTKFDRLCAPLRARIAIRTLENLRKDGEADWEKAAVEVIGHKLI